MDNTSTEFKVGDTVTVLRASRLPKIEEPLGVGVVERITYSVETLYWVNGFPVARNARVLRAYEANR